MDVKCETCGCGFDTFTVMYMLCFSYMQDEGPYFCPECVLDAINTENYSDITVIRP